MKLIVRDKLYIPIKDISHEAMSYIKDKFSFNLYAESGCRLCPYLQDRPSAECRGCDNNLGLFKFYVFTHNGKYVGVDLGSRALIKSLLSKLGDYSITDHRPTPPFTNPLKFNDKVAFDYQKLAVADLAAKGYGVLESAPRTGKTVMGAGVVIKIGTKALILAHQEDLLEQFYATFMSIDTAAIFTNCHKFDDAVGVCKKYEDFERYDICLATYQTFISPSGMKLLKRIRSMFGTVLVDEVHRAGADRYSEIVGTINSRYRIGMTATYDRKDGKHKVVSYVFGRVEHSTPAESLVPIVQAHDTGVQCTKHYKIWQYAMRFLETNVQRNRFILKYIKEDVAAGRSIIIPVTSHRMVNTLVPAINKICGIGTAMGWHGKLSKADRRQVLEYARSGEIRVVVAMRSMLTGVNVQRWDTVYEIMPINNPPNFRQEYRRICTPMEGKPKPMLRFFVDRWSLVQRCFMNCVRDVLKPDKVEFTESTLRAIKDVNKKLRVGTNDHVHDEYKPVKVVHKPIKPLSILKGSL